MTAYGMDKEAFKSLIKGMSKLKGALGRSIGGPRTALSKILGGKDPMSAALKKLPKSAPDWFRASIHGENPHKVWRAMARQSYTSGDGSLLLWPIKSLAEKIIGGAKGVEKIRGGTWKYISAPALRADMALGRKLEKLPGGKSIFRVKEKVPWGMGIEKEITRSSALAPLMKVRDIAEPILVGVGLEKGIKSLSKKKTDQGPNTMDDQQLREKVASVMLQLHEENKGHEKRGQALKLLYKKAEMGYERFPKTYSELEIKLAALVNEDLVVLEKALELAGGNVKLGELDERDSRATMSSAEKFRADILSDQI
jgi:hypothetical protein